MTNNLAVTRTKTYRARFYDEDDVEVTGVTDLVWSSVVDGDITFAGASGQDIHATGVQADASAGIKVHEPVTGVEATFALEVIPVVQTIFRATISEVT